MKTHTVTTLPYGAVTSTNDTLTIIGRRSYFESVFGDLDKLAGSDKDPKGLINALKRAKQISPLFICAVAQRIFSWKATVIFIDS